MRHCKPFTGGLVKEDYLYSTILVCHTHKALRHGSHSFAWKVHHACLSFVSVHQMAPPLTEVANIQLQACSLLLIYRPQRDEGWDGMVGWPI